MGGMVYDIGEEGIPNRAKETLSVTIGVFFDGTSNNKKNIGIRESYDTNKNSLSKKEQEAYEKYGKDKGSSYKGGFTNVVKLQEIYRTSTKQAPFIDSVYIEGIGTVNIGSDDTLDGTGLGRNENGIRGKVFRACHEISKSEVLQWDNIDKEIGYITLDIFGFSRGAAAARSFAYEAIRKDGLKNINTNIINEETHADSDIDSLKYSLEKGVQKYGMLGYCLKKNTQIELDNVKIKIRYIGVFDTVASFARSAALNPEFKRGATQLHLNDGLKKATKVVHLVSEGEHRKNFAITPIPENGEKNIEIILPGVHSDIGGGYIDGVGDNNIEIDNQRSIGKLELEQYKNYLVENRWYKNKEDELCIKDKALWGNRKSLSNKYEDIPLNFMYTLMSGSVLFDSDIYNKKYKIYPQATIQSKLKEALLKDFNTMLPLQQEYRIKAEVNKAKQSNAMIFSPMDITSMGWEQPPFENYVDSSLRMYHSDKNKLDYPTPAEIVSYFHEKLKPTLEGRSHCLKILTYKVFINNYAKTDDNLPPTSFFLKKREDSILDALIEQIFLGILRNKYLHWSAHCESSWGIAPFEPQRNSDSGDFNRKRQTHPA
ncbi:T6SS phospholipase effector Tle1-like catalytic domain-containing protein [Dysgonomonas sp. GY617]|uniref:phospholipase effector Tle1 domain-containing protein n=1 Tax=Dysgonomonas sp. GY617 TaxID=2780420 RepID=UPI0018848B01|nr:DUF2235 domain-containing protein [Dysgonomonas sp. GY617]MBF0578067.1 DUF2235 domain-containing protein [Dysgonomonas sp. GY617]